MKNFQDINFGYASAQQEGTRSPTLLIDGYLDLHDICKTAIDGSEFLILGYKGSGKSAVAERLRLLHQNDSQVFITNVDLEDFPYTTFSQIVPGKDAPQSRYPTAWSWILLIHLIASLDRDAGIEINDQASLDDTLLSLREMGLLPITGLPRLVRRTSETTVKVSVPQFFEGQQKSQTVRIDVPYFVDNLKRLVANIRTESRHLIVLDGLDEIVTNQSAQWDSLGSLVFEVNRLNALFAKCGLSAKIVLLCRTDIFELLHGANKNKIRQDSSIELDWYSDPAAPHKSRLVAVADLRAKIAIGRPVSIFAEYFPKKLFGKGAPQSLLDATRHTPRDFLQLLKNIQSCCDNNAVSTDQVRNGMRKYSVEYFMPEMIDELQGYVSSEEAKEFFKLAGSLRQRDFSRAEILAIAAAESAELSIAKIDTVLKALFECSGLGNIQILADRRVFFTFRYRNRHAPFNINQRMILHRGLWRALNLPVDGIVEAEVSPTPDVPSKPRTLRVETLRYPAKRVRRRSPTDPT